MTYDVAFLTIMYPNECRKFFDEKGFVQGGENITFIQNALIEGMTAIEGCHCHVINKLLIAKQKNCHVPKKTWKHSEGLMMDDISFAYINKPFLSSNILFWFSKKHIKDWVGKNIAEEKVMVAYAVTNHNLKALAYAKHRNPNIKTCMIVPDLPENTKERGKSILINFKHAVTDFLTNRAIEKYGKHIDS